MHEGASTGQVFDLGSLLGPAPSGSRSITLPLREGLKWPWEDTEGLRAMRPSRGLWQRSRVADLERPSPLQREPRRARGQPRRCVHGLWATSPLRASAVASVLKQCWATRGHVGTEMDEADPDPALRDLTASGTVVTGQHQAQWREGAQEMLSWAPKQVKVAVQEQRLPLCARVTGLIQDTSGPAVTGVRAHCPGGSTQGPKAPSPLGAAEACASSRSSSRASVTGSGTRTTPTSSASTPPRPTRWPSRSTTAGSCRRSSR